MRKHGAIGILACFVCFLGIFLSSCDSPMLNPFATHTPTPTETSIYTPTNSSSPTITPTPTDSPTPGITPPTAPFAPELVPGDSQIDVGWTTVSGATSYNVFYNIAENSAGATQFGGDFTGTTATITGLINNTLYYVWLKAKNAGVSSAFSLPSLTTPFGPSSHPAVHYKALGGGSTVDISDFNGMSNYSIFAPQPASKPESDAAPLSSYFYSLDTIDATLAAKNFASQVWTAGSFSAGQVKWFYFNAVSGSTHNIYWDDFWDGSGSYTADIIVSAYREDLSTSYFINSDSGYSAPNTIIAAATEKVFIKVLGYSSSTSGTFAIQDALAGTPSMIYPMLNTGSKKKAARVFNPNNMPFAKLSTSHIFKSSQTNWDSIMRSAENTVLASKTKQLNKKLPGINPAAPFPIAVDTTWDGILIAVTGLPINATCEYISDHAYFFIDNRDIAAMSSYLAAYGTSFDAIYDVNRTKFGTENDTDANGKVIIVFSQELTGGLLGYFYPVDKFPKTMFAASNEGDIFYITTDAAYQGDTVNGTLAHEFQHMIYFDEHYNRGSMTVYAWLNEALSQAAEYYNNYLSNHLGWINAFLSGNYLGLSLTNWTSSNYGYGAIYIRYLIERFGDTAIKNMCATNLAGVAAVESATGTDFNTLFNDFAMAVVMSGTGDVSNPIYSFSTLNLQTVQPTGRGGLLPAGAFAAGTSISGNWNEYRLIFILWNGNFGSMTLSGTDVAGAAFGLSQ